jgi:ketosteroid isomerase-like protein
MSQENVEIVRRGYAHRQATGEFLEEIIASDFVWDMSTFRGWPEQQVYEGIEEARRFIREWTAAFDGWEIEVVTLHDAGADKVVGILRQRGRSKTTGLPVDMLLAQVFTIQGGKERRMEMYADPDEALKAVGREE